MSDTERPRGYPFVVWKSSRRYGSRRFRSLNSALECAKEFAQMRGHPESVAIWLGSEYVTVAVVDQHGTRTVFSDRIPASLIRA